MKQLTVVLVQGGYGVGKTRVLGQLAGFLDPGVRVAALVHQTGPVNLDPLWLPGLPVVAMEEGCACGGAGELLECLRLLRSRSFDLALVELAGDQAPDPMARAVAGLEGAEVIVVPADDVEPDEDLEALRMRFGPKSPAEGSNPQPAPTSDGEHGDDCGCAHHAEGHSHHHEGCACAERRAEPQWMPFWFAEGVDEARLRETLSHLPEAVIRVKGVVRLGEKRWLRVDRAAGRVTCGAVTAEDLPELYDVESLAGDDALDPVPPDGGGLLLLWTRSANEADSVALEWEVERSLAACFGVVADPTRAAAFAAESLDQEELIFEALAAARTAAVAEPHVAQHAELLANCYHELLENERALVLLREAARRDPRHLSSRLNAARLHLAYEEAPEACSLLEDVVVDHPEDPDARALLGEALAVQGKLAAAAEHLEIAAVEKPEDDVLRSMLCHIYAELGDYQRALSYNSEALSLDPEDDGAMYLRGELLLRLDRAEDAAESLEEALAAGNESPWVMTALGIAQVQCGNDPEASGCFADAFVLAQEQLEQLPDDSSAVDLLLAASFRGRIDQIPAVWDRLGTLDIRELEKARDTLSLAPERGEAQRTLDAIAEILGA